MKFKYNRKFKFNFKKIKHNLVPGNKIIQEQNVTWR